MPTVLQVELQRLVVTLLSAAVEVVEVQELLAEMDLLVDQVEAAAAVVPLVAVRYREVQEEQEQQLTIQQAVVAVLVQLVEMQQSTQGQAVMVFCLTFLDQGLFTEEAVVEVVKTPQTAAVALEALGVQEVEERELLERQ